MQATATHMLQAFLLNSPFEHIFKKVTTVLQSVLLTGYKICVTSCAGEKSELYSAAVNVSYE